MQITPVQNFNLYHSTVKPKKEVSFTAHYDFGKVEEQVGDGVIYRMGRIHNYSALARDLQLFLEMPQLIEKKFPNGVKIYDYGCSAGYEPTSIVLGLHNHFSEEEVSNYIPIIARDCNPKIIKEAKNYRLRLNDDESYKLDFFENIKKEDYLITKRYDRTGQKIHDYTDKLKQEIIYEEGNLFDDLDDGKLSEEPCVVLLRNAWQFMTPMGRKQLADKLYSKLPPKSLVIIGSCDLMNGVDKNLKRAGFKNIKENYDITFNNDDLATQYRRMKQECSVKTHHFCFEKEE